jgi:hypothetical protein
MIHIFQRSIPQHGIGEALEVGINIRYNFDFVGELAAMFEDRVTEGYCCLFAAFYA